MAWNPADMVTQISTHRVTHIVCHFRETSPNSRTHKCPFLRASPTKKCQKPIASAKGASERNGDFPPILGQESHKYTSWNSLFSNYAQKDEFITSRFSQTLTIHYFEIFVQGSFSLWEFISEAPVCLFEDRERRTMLEAMMLGASVHRVQVRSCCNLLCVLLINWQKITYSIRFGISVVPEPTLFFKPTHTPFINRMG